MHMTFTQHAQDRCKQRGIPPLITQWLSERGDQDYDGHGGCRLFFSKASKRKLEQDYGRAVVGKLSQWLDVFLVEDSVSGEVITVGHRHHHLRRK